MDDRCLPLDCIKEFVCPFRIECFENPVFLHRGIGVTSLGKGQPEVIVRTGIIRFEPDCLPVGLYCLLAAAGYCLVVFRSMRLRISVSSEVSCLRSIHATVFFCSVSNFSLCIVSVLLVNKLYDCEPLVIRRWGRLSLCTVTMQLTQSLSPCGPMFNSTVLRMS